jgi:hypothetical protein
MVANEKSATSGPNATITIGQDGKTSGRSFDVEVKDGSQTTNIDVKTPQTGYSLGGISDQVSAVADKVNASTPGKKEAAVVLKNFPPSPQTQKDGSTKYVDANGDQYLILKDGVTKIPQNGPINDLLDNLNGTGNRTAPAGASKLDSIVIYNDNGGVVTTLTKGANGQWSRFP